VSGWQSRAACAGLTWVGDIEDRAYWGSSYQTPPARIAEGRALCLGCPVVVECRRDALQRDERFGMWGGMTPLERQQVSETRGQQRTTSGQYARGRLIGAAERAEIHRRTGLGESASVIARALGLRVGAVVNVRLTAPRVEGPHDARVAALRSGPDPLSLREVAAVLGVSKATAGRAALRVEARTVIPAQREA
jgi:WhiB family redox-sensing transcriptional regulator